MYSIDERYRTVDELLTGSFNSVERLEAHVLRNRLTAGLTISDVHTINAIGLSGSSSMGSVAERLGITLGTLTVAVNRLVSKGYVKRERSTEDRRRMEVALTTDGRKACRAFDAFHFRMIEQALEDLNDEELDCLIDALNKLRVFFDTQNELARKNEDA